MRTLTRFVLNIWVVVILIAICLYAALAVGFSTVVSMHFYSHIFLERLDSQSLTLAERMVVAAFKFSQH